MLVGAEAGGGKTRLTSEFVAGVRERAQVLSGDCVALSEAELPYAPFTAALRRVIGEQGTAEVAALLPEQDAGELARLLPDFGTPAAEADPAAARSRLFELLLTLLERLAERRPLVLVVEDVHWADPLTQDLLTFLVRNLRHAAVLLVVTYRSDELNRSHSVRRLLAELDRVDGVTSLELPRLTRAEVAAQLEGILDHPPEPALVGAVYERTDGIPLFTEALVGPGGALRAEPPGPLRNLLLGAVQQLPERTQQVLRTLAGGGVQVGHALLRAVTGLDDAALTAALRPAVAANVLVGDADGYAFRHELFRDAVRGELLAGERIRVRDEALLAAGTPVPR